MSTTTSEEVSAAAEVETSPRYQQRVTARTKERHAELAQREKQGPPAERLSDERLWELARKRARSEVHHDMAKEMAGAAARSARSTAVSAAHRNRKQLAPWLITAPYAVTGEAVNLLATYGDGNPIAISGAVAVTTTGASLLAWRQKLAKKTPGRFRQKMQAGLGLLCGWTSVMPFVPTTDQAGMWLALVGGTAWMGLSWWRDNAHPIPSAVPAPRPTTDEEGTSEPSLSAQSRRVHGIVTAWTEKVASGNRAPIPGSTITHQSSNGVVDCYQISLDDTGPVSGEEINQHVKDVSFRLGVLSDWISFEVTSNPQVVVMRHQVGAPSYTYTGPVVLCDGQPISSRWEITPGSSVDIVYGYYLDGQGQVSYRVIDAGSVNSMFILGSTGSGKTVTMEVLAIGLRFLGAYVIYIDGQGGASSQALAEHADATYEPDEDGVHALSEVVAGVCQTRSDELKTNKSLRNRYTYSPHRPPVIVMMEEAHRVWCMKTPSGARYGEVFGTFGSEIRKLGVGYVAASQDFDLTGTFGGSARLRDSFLAGGSFAAMRLTDKSRIGMLPSSCPPLTTVPKHGYGFSPFGQRPDALWRVPALVYEPGQREPDPEAGEQWPEEWMQQYQPEELDQATQIGLSAGGMAPENTITQPQSTTHATTNSVGSVVVRFPGMEHTPAETPTVGLTGAEETALDALSNQAHTPTTLGEQLQVSSQAAGRHLRRLAEKGVAQRHADGAYVALD